MRDWVVSTEVFQDTHFISLKKEDRKLARAMGLDMEKRHPWSGCKVLTELVRLRDEAVTRMISDYMMAGDEKADTVAGPPAVAQRSRHFTSANLPDIIQIAFPAFAMLVGTHPTHTMQVISTPIKGSNLRMELSERNLDFLANATRWYKETHADSRLDLPELEEPAAKWRRRGCRSAAISCSYREESGKWQHHIETPKKQKGVDFNETVREVSHRVQAFYENNHWPDDDDDDA